VRYCRKYPGRSIDLQASHQRIGFLKMAAFWDVAQYTGNLSEVSNVLPHHRPDNGSSMHLRNVGLLLQEYTASYHRRLQFL
jgi:hypothetical protein